MRRPALEIRHPTQSMSLAAVLAFRVSTQLQVPYPPAGRERLPPGTSARFSKRSRTLPSFTADLVSRRHIVHVICETRGCPKRHERPAPPWTGWPRDSQRGWSAGVRVGKVDRQSELLEAIGLDEFLLCRCPGGEGERHDPAPLSSEHRLHVAGKDRPCRGYP